MVDTIKFSQMTSGGDLANNETTPGLKSGANVLFNNPWTFLAPGTTAQRPAPSAAINYRLRFNTDDQLYEYYNAVLGVWSQIEESAVTNGPFITYKADATLPDAQNLGLLADGLLKQTISLGIATVDIAVNGTDYYGPGFVIPGTDGGTGINNGARTIDLGSPSTGYILTSDVSGNATWQSITASGGITSITGDTGSAIPSAGVIVLTGASTGLTFAGATNTLTLGGILLPVNGGTGIASPTAHGILVGEGASPVNPIVLSSGQILIGSTGADPVAAAINSGTGVLVANGAGSITVSLAPIATLTGLVNTTGGAAAPIATTLSAWMDAALGSVRGDILYRNTTIWTVLAPGTAGFSLQTGGAGADPSYSNTFTNSTLVTPATLGVQQQALNMNSHLINNVSTPVSSTDAVNKAYVDTTALNGTSVYAASAGSLGTVTQSGSGVGATITNAGVQAVFALDGVNPPAGTDVLIKNTATGMTSANEGIYTVTNAGSGATNWVLTRSTSYDTATEINQTGLILIRNGSTLAGTAWYNAATIVTVDTTAFSYSQFGNIIFPVSLSQGGTNAALTAIAGGVVYSTASAMAISAAGLTGQVFQSNGAAPPTWSTPTYPSASGSAGKIMISDGTNNIYSTPLWPTTGGTSGSVVISDGTNKINSTSLWPNTVGTAGKLMRSDGTVNAYSTFTIPDTFAINTIPYASSANVLGVIAAVNSAVMVSSAGGVPSFSTTLPANIAMTTPLISGSIKDANGNIILSFNPSATAVNYFQVQNAAAGNLPSLSLIGSDTNITGNLFSKGTGGFNIYGCSNASNSPAGAVGEIISSTVLAASPVSLTSTVNVDITSISLTAGDWDVYGNISYNPPGVASVCFGWANTSSATTPDLALTNNVVTGVVVNRWGFNIPFLRVNASGAQTVYLTASATFASGSAAAYGSIFARRRR